MIKNVERSLLNVKYISRIRQYHSIVIISFKIFIQLNQQLLKKIIFMLHLCKNMKKIQYHYHKGYAPKIPLIFNIFFVS